MANSDIKDKRKKWQSFVGDVTGGAVIVNRRLVRDRIRGLFTLSPIDTDFDDLRMTKRAGIIFANSHHLTNYRTNPDAGGIADMMESAGLIPDDIDVVICISASDREINVDDLPFDWDKAQLLFSTADDPRALLTSSDIARVEFDDPRNDRFETHSRIPTDMYTFTFQPSDEMLRELARLFVGRCAYGAAWFYANLTDEYDTMWENGWDAGYIAKAAEFLANGGLSLDEGNIRGYRDSFIKGEYLTVLYEKEIEEAYPELHELGEILDDAFWMLGYQTAGISLSIEQKDGALLEKVKEALDDCAFDEKVRARVETKVSADDIMLGTGDKAGSALYASYASMWVHGRRGNNQADVVIL